MTLLDPIMAVDEGTRILPVCVDFVGSNLGREAVVTLTTVTGQAVGELATHSTLSCVYTSPLCVCVFQKTWTMLERVQM